MSFVHLLQSIEGGIYEVIAWALLFPKTLLKTIFKPWWGPNYVNEEWETKVKEEERYDQSLSPGLLWLIVCALQILFTDPIETASSLFEYVPQFTKLLTLIKALEGESRLATQILFLLVYPFIYLMWMEWLKEGDIQRSKLKRVVQIHCYALAPAQFLSIIVPGFGFLFMWFYETFVFRSEFKSGWLKSIWYGIAPQLLLLAAYFSIAFLSGFFGALIGNT